MSPEIGPHDESEIGDVVDYAVDHLLIGSSDELIKELLGKRKGDTAQNLAKVKEKLAGLKTDQTITTELALPILVEVTEDTMQYGLSGKIAPRAPGSRSGYCGFTSSHVAVVGEQLGLQADIFQVMQLNTHRGVPSEASMKHAFTVLTDARGKRFIVDLSFCQFVDPETSGVRYYDLHAPDAEAVEFAKQFTWPGFTELTDESLAKYLRLTTTSRIDARKLTVKQLMADLPRRPLYNQRSDVLSDINKELLDERVRAARATTPLRKPNPFIRFIGKK